MLKVRLIDRGRNTIVARQNIKKLHSQFHLQPALSICARLANLKDMTAFSPTALSTIKRFFEESCITMDVIRTPADDKCPFGVELHNKRQNSLRN